LLSESWSPAPAPCGIPFFVAGAAAFGVVLGAAFGVVGGAAGVVAGAAAAELVAGATALVDELDAAEPHAATPNAASANRPAARRRTDLGMVVIMFAPCVRVNRNFRYLCDARTTRFVPGP
jgi:hypothetical protein